MQIIWNLMLAFIGPIRFNLQWYVMIRKLMILLLSNFIANYSMIGYKGCFIQCLYVIHYLFWRESFCWRFAFAILFHFSHPHNWKLQLSSQLRTFSYHFISAMLLFHALGHNKSILYICSFKIYTSGR